MWHSPASLKGFVGHPHLLLSKGSMYDSGDHVFQGECHGRGLTLVEFRISLGRARSCDWFPDLEASFQRFAPDTFQRILYQNLDAQPSLQLMNAWASLGRGPPPATAPLDEWDLAGV